MDNKYIRLLKNTGIVFVGNVGSKLLTFLMLPFYTKWLSPAEYGSFDLIFTYSTLLLPLCFLCIIDSIFIFPANKSLKEQSCYFCWGLVFSGSMALLSGILLFVGQHFFSDESFFVVNLPLIMGVLGATFLQNYLQQFSRAIGNMRVFALSGFIVAAINCGMAFWLVPQQGVRGMVVSIIVAHLTSFILTVYFIKGWKYFSIKFGDRRDYLFPMLAYSIPMVPNAVMWWLIFSLSKPVIEKYCGSGELGIYAFASKIAGLLAISGQILSSAWQCSVIDEFGKPGYPQFYNRMLFALLVLQGFVAVCISIISRECLGAIVDVKFLSSYKYISLLCFSAVMAWHAGYIGTNFQAAKNSIEYLKTSLVGLCVVVVTTFLFVPLLGILGAVCASILGNVALLIARALKVERYVHMACWRPSVCLLSFIFMCCILVLLPDVVRFAGYIALFVVVVSLAIWYKKSFGAIFILLGRNK